MAASLSGAFTRKSLFEALVFILTGIVSTLVAQLLVYSGVPSWTNLLPFANYSGMCFAQIATAFYLGNEEAGYTPVTQKGSHDKTPETSPASSLETRQAGFDGIAEEEDSSNTNNTTKSGSIQRRSNNNASVLSTVSTVQVIANASSLTPSAAVVTAASLNSPVTGAFTISLKYFVPIAVTLDVLGFYLHVIGLELAGSALYQVIYSSVVVWAALGARILRGPEHASLNSTQIMGITVVLLGLGYSALSEGSSGDHSHTHSHTSGSVSAGGIDEMSAQATAVALATKKLLGVCASLGAAVVYGTVYALAECLMSDAHPPKPAVVATYVGLGVTGTLGSFILFAVLPHWDEVASSVALANVLSWGGIICCFLIMMFSALCHAIVYYSLLPAVGAATVGLLNAGRAVGVFVFSGIVFCSWQTVQCFTWARGVATVVVIGGIIVFTYGKALKNHHPEQEVSTVAISSATSIESVIKV
jgi:hypothetical protein